MQWGGLDYWETGEWQVVEERLADLTAANILWNPGKRNLFRALKATPFEEVKVCLLGQDPYPNHKHAMGLAFSVPGKDIPSSLSNILKEYCDDTHNPMPETGDLTPWTRQGVLLWNAVPSCTAGLSMSHAWPEWELLTQKILTKLSKETSCVFVGLGKVAQNIILRYVSEEDSNMLFLTHPSPRAQKYGTPFLGCRMFTRINSILASQSQSPIDWRL